MKKCIQLLAMLCLTASLGFSQTTILDFETPATSTTFQYFGSTLEATLNNIIPNPDATGINESATVGESVRPAAAADFAGFFSEPNPMTPIDLTTENQVCVKVWFPEEGDLLIKLEQGTAGDWQELIPITETNTWVEVCANTLLPFGGTVGAGNTYNRLVLFFDFGTVDSPEDVTYYFDDVVTKEPIVVVEDVTFSVDMNEYTDAFTSVSVFGTFNGFDPSANPMTDTDGDGVWTATVPVETGTIEYLFIVDQMTAESFVGGESCTTTFEQFTNREVTITEETDLGVVCWESCFTCGSGVSITFNVGTDHIMASPDGIFLAGGGNFGNPGDNPMTDPDGDGVYSITITQPMGFSSFYTFTNGNCPDFSCKENIGGQDCANPDNFNDRFLNPVMQDTVINTCFGLCTIDTNCGDAPENGMITFAVNMAEYTDAFTGVSLAGSFNGWDAAANPMADDDNDGIWELTLPLDGGVYEYKFVADAAFEELEEGSSCTITSSGFTNRLLEVDGDATLGVVCYASCADCSVSIDELAELGINFQVRPTVANDQVLLTFGKALPVNSRVSVINISGQVVQIIQVDGVENQNLDVSQLSAGMYFLQLQHENAISVRRMVKQ